MYNDFKLIDEEKLVQLMESYNKKIKVKISNIDIEQNVKLLLSNLIVVKHYLSNLENNSSNSINFEVLKEVNDNLTKIIEKLQNLYDIVQINSTKEKSEDNAINNITNINFNLIDSIKIVFDLFNYEDNIKIKNSLKIIFQEIIDIFKKINHLEHVKPKIISFFKKYW